MKRSRVTSAVLTCASLLALAACGGDGAPVAAGSAPPAPASAAPAATSVAPAPSSPAAAQTTAGATGGASDKKLCTSAKKSGDAMKTAFAEALVQSRGEPKPAVLKKILTDFADDMTALAASAEGAGKVATASKQVGVEASKAAAAANPMDAAADPGFEKAMTKFAAACTSAGVNLDL